MWALFLVFSDSESRSHRRILCSWGLGQPPQQAFSRSGYRDALLATFTIGELKEYLQNQRVRSCHNLPYEKVGKNEPVCIADEVPFEIPESWEWAKIETISMPIGNKNNQIQSKEVLSTGKIPVVSQGKDLIDGYCNDVSKKIDVLPLVMFGDHTRNVKYIDFEFVIGADGTKFHKILSCNSEYIYYWMLYAAETLRNTLAGRQTHQFQSIGIFAAAPQNEILKLFKSVRRQRFVAVNFLPGDEGAVFGYLVNRVHALASFLCHLLN